LEFHPQKNRAKGMSGSIKKLVGNQIKITNQLLIEKMTTY
jgi:hypothetical protein